VLVAREVTSAFRDSPEVVESILARLKAAGIDTLEFHKKPRGHK